MPRRYVYVIGPSAVKIGVSDDVEARLAHLQIGSPVRLAVLWSALMDNGDETEAHLHRVFADRRMHGEWFDLGSEPIPQVEAAVSAAHSGDPKFLARIQRKQRRERSVRRPQFAPTDSDARKLAEAMLSVWPDDADRATSAELAARLLELPGWTETWPTVGQMQRGIAATLRAYGGGPTKIRLGASTANGYLRSAVAIVASL